MLVRRAALARSALKTPAAGADAPRALSPAQGSGGSPACAGRRSALRTPAPPASARPMEVRWRSPGQQHGLLQHNCDSSGLCSIEHAPLQPSRASTCCSAARCRRLILAHARTGHNTTTCACTRCSPAAHTRGHAIAGEWAERRRWRAGRGFPAGHAAVGAAAAACRRGCASRDGQRGRCEGWPVPRRGRRRRGDLRARRGAAAGRARGPQRQGRRPAGGAWGAGVRRRER